MRRAGYFDKALALRPVFPDTYSLLAAFAWKDGDSVKARSYELNILEGLANKKGMWGDVCESLGRILMDMDEPAARRAVSAQRRLRRNPVPLRPAPHWPGLSSCRVIRLVGKLEAESALTLNESCSEAHALLGK